MESVLLIIAIVSVSLGTFFSGVGVLGYFRFPDVYTRLHTTGKIGVFGVVFLLVAAAVKGDAAWGYALVLIFFLLASGPATAHAMASAAHRIGLKRKHVLRDDLADFERKSSNNGSAPPEAERLSALHDRNRA